jgi:hypothetical protein
VGKKKKSREDSSGPIALEPSTSAASSATFALPVFRAEEKLKCKFDAEGELLSMDLKGELTLTLPQIETGSIPFFSSISMQQHPSTRFFKFVSNPKISKEAMQQGLISPLSSVDPQGERYNLTKLMKWSPDFSQFDESSGGPPIQPPLSLSVTHTPHPSRKESLTLTISYQVIPQEDKDAVASPSLLGSMEISFRAPSLTSSQFLKDNPQYREGGDSAGSDFAAIGGGIVGSVALNQGTQKVVWKVGEVGGKSGKNSTASVSLVVPKKVVESMFPVTVYFVSPQPYCKFRLSGLTHQEDGDEVPFTFIKELVTEEYQMEKSE